MVNPRYAQPHSKSDLAYFTHDYKTECWSDGTETIAHVVPKGDEDVVLGRGVARRLKGEKRNETAGLALALSRAFADAARHFAEVADAALEGELE
jgi:hypothetical protein